MMQPIDQPDLRINEGWHRAAWAIAVLITAGIIWANLAELDEVAVADGEVVPVDKVKIVQHLEGGIIEQIFVSDGQSVEAGDKLVQIDLPVTAVNAQEIEARRDGLVLARARLTAEIAGEPLSFPAVVAARRPELATAQRQTYDAHREELTTKLAALRQQIRQRELAVKELTAARAALQTDLRLARENFAISEDLARDGLTSKIDHLERKREVRRLEGELQTLTPAIPRAQAAIGEVKERLREEQLRFERELLEQLSRTEAEIVRTDQQLAEATGQARRTVIRSPIAGIVKHLRFHTIGGVVGPGDPILELVPSHERLVIQARLRPMDRGYVVVGQSARAKISAYDFVRYGALEGRITHIGADSTIAADGTSYFEVVMAPEQTYLGDRPGVLVIKPGMTAVLDIQTGTKSVMQYLLKPVIKAGQEAFRER